MASADRIQIRIDEQGLEAWVSVLEGPKLTRDEFMEQLESAGVSAGIDDAVVETIVRAIEEESAIRSEVCIARGVPPEPCTPSALALNTPTEPISGVEQEDGSIDFRERLLIVPVEDGEQIGRIIPAIEGKPGHDVSGEEIPPLPPEDSSVKHGEGISIDADGNLFATRAGARTVEADGKIDVVDFLVHPGHVDLKSGNLKTEGSLEVKRNVTAEMSVRSTADLKIGGSVDGGKIYAGGTIEIVGAAIGRDGGSVTSGGDLVVSHALGIRLSCGGQLTVLRGVSTSILVAKEIEVLGTMLSDSAQAETRIVVRDAGSPAGGPCLLRAAYPLDGDGCDQESDSPSDESDGAKKTEAADRQPDPGRSDSRKRRVSRKKQKELELAARGEWQKRQRELLKTAYIEVKGTARAGCRMDFGVAQLVLDADVTATRFRFDLGTGKIVTDGIS